MTGAGWGGCTVSLIRASQVPSFRAFVRARFYALHHPALLMKEGALEDVVFPSRPSMGACILRDLEDLRDGGR